MKARAIRIFDVWINLDKIEIICPLKQYTFKNDYKNDWHFLIEMDSGYQHSIWSNDSTKEEIDTLRLTILAEW